MSEKNELWFHGENIKGSRWIEGNRDGGGGGVKVILHEVKEQLLSIENILKNIEEKTTSRFSDSLTCIILYGSWAKGTAREDSDIDLLIVFKETDDSTRKRLYDIEREIDSDRSITFVSASSEDFRKEKIPLYTAIKKEGKILWGDVDLAINSDSPHIKYAEAFKKSKELETRKVEMAEKLIKEYPDYGHVDLSFVASKHAIQMALAMKGLGYSSKVSVLLPLVKEHISEDTAQKFKNLFDLYVRSEYSIESITAEEAKLAVEYAKGILRVCYGR